MDGYISSLPFFDGKQHNIVKLLMLQPINFPTGKYDGNTDNYWFPGLDDLCAVDIPRMGMEGRTRLGGYFDDLFDYCDFALESQVIMKAVNGLGRSKRNLAQPEQKGILLLPYLYSLVIVAGVTLVGLFVRDVITPTNLVMPYLLGVASIAAFWGRGPAVFASFWGVVAFDIFLVPPYLTFVVEDAEYIITFLAFFIVGVLISGLTMRVRLQAIETRERETKEQLQSALLNSISHDFRTPLATITGTLSSLDTENGRMSKADYSGLIRHALEEAETLNRLVNNLLNMSRLEGGALKLNLSHVDVQDLIGATLEQMKNREDCQINIKIPEEPPIILADFVFAEQALMNVLDNAIKYSPMSTIIDIFVRTEDGWVLIEVADNGLGIDKRDLPHLFEKFYRGTSASRKAGTGLGLAIVKGIMDAHRASVDILPRESGGTIVRLAFPRVEFMERGVSNAR